MRIPDAVAVDTEGIDDEFYLERWRNQVPVLAVGEEDFHGLLAFHTATVPSMTRQIYKE